MNNDTPIQRRSLIKMCAAAMIAPAVADDVQKQPPGQPLATIPHSEEFVIANAKGMKYRIMVAKPSPINPELPLMVRGAKAAPIYVLDGDENFGAVTDMARLMQFGGELPPCLVVGIGYEDAEAADRLDYRRGDLTPTKNPGHPDWRKTKSVDYGGAPLFRRFLVETLQPAIERRFDLDRDSSVLIGHSLGGLFALDTLVQEPEAFANYLSLSPSLWFDDRLVLRQFKDALVRGAKYKGRVAVYVGDREERISDPPARMTSNVLELGRLVAEYRNQFAGVTVSVLPNTSHHTILGSGITQGLEFLISPADRRSETF